MLSSGIDPLTGSDPAGQAVVLAEDVITTGGAVISAARALRELGAIASAVVCAIDRSQRGNSQLDEDGITVRSALTKDLIDWASASEIQVPAALVPLHARAR
jgi:orotate phosphoribosyltransferase